MKTIPPQCPEPETGVKYWRSLDQAAESPAFRQYLEREFPSGASELTDPVTRRSFVKLMSSSFLLAGFGFAGTGCRRPVEYIVPFSKMPENYIHGNPKYYATSMPVRNSAIPLLAKANEGRPTKLEGNPQHPDSNGGSDRFAQASILDLYDADRATRFARNGNNVTAADAMDALAEISKEAAANGGEGLAFLATQSSSPSRSRLVNQMVAKLPKAKWAEFEPISFTASDAAATAVSGAASSVKTYHRIDKAKVIVSFDSDFLGNEADLHVSIRQFAKGRKTTSTRDSMSRLYVVEGLFTITGANADHRLRVPTNVVAAVAAATAAELNGDLASAVSTLSANPAVAGYKKWIQELVKDLQAAGAGNSLILAGERQPQYVHVLVQAMNIALGNVGSTVSYLTPAEQHGASSIQDLVGDMNAGNVKTLVILGGNPAYNAPADLEWEKAIEKVGKVVRLGYYEDESFPAKGWNLPQAHFLESWGDARTSDGTLVPVQPLIEPLFGGLTELEVIARVLGESTTAPYAIVRETFSGIKAPGDEAWKQFLFDGFVADTAYAAASTSVSLPAAIKAVSDATVPTVTVPAKDNLEVVFHRDYSMDDGRFNNNGWMQELPDPITKMTWENVFLMSVKTAHDLGVYTENEENNRLKAQWVKLTVNGREVEGPVWAVPGHADNSIGLSLGHGRTKTGRIGRETGYNAYKVRTTTALHTFVGAKLTPMGRKHPLSVTQDHGAMEGRPIIREATLKEYQEHPKFAKGFDMEKPPTFEPLYQNPLDEMAKTAHHQWGMSIDLSACVGCSSCMVACQSENNIPIVGKEQVSNNREMHWLRIDRYFTGDVAREDGIQIINQPMMCQHCEAAPCESVCPVNATVHDQEGLNLMVYNRCVGTRYCSNNCPYKVRRFNFFDYNRRTLEQLKEPYTTPLTHSTEGEWDMLRWWKDPDRSTKPTDEWELLKLVKNPDVTVRMRGVMEKCTFCLQRIESAKIRQKVKAGASGDVIVPDGSFKTACQQACPAEAIVFGNIADPASEVSKAKANDRTYQVLDFLNTKPRTTYQARLRNPNPNMPDTYNTPNSTEEYEKKSGLNPLAEEMGEAVEPHKAEGAVKGAK